MKASHAARPLAIALVAIAAVVPSGVLAATSPRPPATSPATVVPDDSFTLETGIAGGRMVFLGVGGTLDGKADPTFHVRPGDVVQITLRNGEGAEHDLAIPAFGVLSHHVVGPGSSTTIVFRATRPGVYSYFCTLPGHRQAGMSGKLIVGNATVAAVPAALDISRPPTDLPPPVGNRPPKVVKLYLEADERKGELAPGTTYDYWTFDGKVPGPMVRVRVGDTVEVHLKNAAHDRMIHSIDMHAVLGPGGGSAIMQVPPGQQRVFTWKAREPGLFVYHCATPMVAEHIANGMFGMVLVEPPGGLPKVDHEFDVMQSEVYTDLPFGKKGRAEFDEQRLLDERPTDFVFNGSVGSLTLNHPMHAKVGDTIRIFFGNGGPNLASAFHIVGEIFGKAYLYGSLASPPIRDIQTVPVPPGSSAVVEFTLREPGRYVLVDHAIARMEQGLAAFLDVDGKPDPGLEASGPAH